MAKAPAAGLLKVRVIGKAGVVRELRGFQAGIHAIFAEGLLEKYFLDKTKARFANYGSNKFAQRRPDGKLWAPPKNSTLRRRKFNAYNPRQALVETGKLRDSVVVLRTVPGFISFAGGKDYFSIGIKKSSTAYKRGLLHQFGGTNKNGAVIPARPFIGINASSDTKAIEDLMGKTMKKART